MISEVVVLPNRIHLFSHNVPMCISRFYVLLFMSSALCLYSSCSKITNHTSTIVFPLENANDYLVEMEDIDAYLSFAKGLPPVKTANDVEVEVVSRDDSPVYYILKYCDGWEILSADKRGPVVLAKSGHKGIDSIKNNPLFKFWLSCLENEIIERRNRDESYIMSDEEQKNTETSIAFWSSLFSHNTDLHTRIGLPDEEDGYWKLTNTIVTEEIVDSVGHFTTTNWHQDSPFNFFCPPKSNDSSHKKPAGCIPIALAQVFTYLNNGLCIPINVNNAYYNDYYVNEIIHFNIDSVFWAGINNSSLSPAKLISHIGLEMGIVYGDDHSGIDDSLVSERLNTLCSIYGLDYTYYSQFSPTFISDCLLNQIPVVVNASGIVYTFLGIPTGYDDGHFFIIDGYDYVRYKTTNVYYYTIRDHGEEIITEQSRYIVTYSDPEILRIRMNWGWNAHDYCTGEFINDVSFALSGNWNPRVYNSDGSPSLDNFIYQRKLYYFN